MDEPAVRPEERIKLVPKPKPAPTPKKSSTSSQIMSFFPAELTPRPAQIEALRQLEIEWKSNSVFVVSAPTACGKELIATTIARWAHKTHRQSSMITVPNKMLVQQVRDNNPRFASLLARADYGCDEPEIGPRGGRSNCGECDACTKATKAQRWMRVAPYGVCNYYVYYSYKLYKDVLIIDEGHRVLDLLKDVGAKRFPQSTYGFDENMSTIGEVIEWAEHEAAIRPRKAVKTLLKELKSLEPSTTLEMVRERHRGRMEYVLKLLPIDVRHLPPWLWPGRKVRKIVFLSATIGPQDIEDMGLGNRRAAYIDVGSPIPPTSRPVWYTPVADMTMATQSESLPLIVDAVKDLASQYIGQRGLIHATYKVAEAMRERMGSDPRFFFHDAGSKSAQFDRWQSSVDGVLVASGMHEGIDLPHDKCRWQVITQVPYPSLEDRAVEVRLEKDPEWYQWQTLKSIMQAAGRVCRTPDDTGATYILDTQWAKFRPKVEHMMPSWFKEACL